MGVRYATREQVKTASDVSTTALRDSSVDNAIEAASRSVEGLTRRRFYPTTATRYFDYPDAHSPTYWRLWLDENEVLSVSSLTSGGHSISSSDYFLEPANDGPPFTHIDLDQSSSASFGQGSTSQRDIAISGEFGYSNDTSPAGTLASSTNDSTTTVAVTNGGVIGVGDLIKVDSERMLVVGRSNVDTTATLASNAAASNNAVSLTLSASDAVHAGEVILIGAERMLVTDVVGTIVVVRRAWDGSVLAAHSTSDAVYASRSLTVSRAVTGTTAASHSSSAPVVRNLVPGPVEALAVALALEQLAQQQAGYARTDKTAATENSARAYVGVGYTFGTGLDALRKHVVQSYGRQARMAAV